MAAIFMLIVAARLLLHLPAMIFSIDHFVLTVRSLEATCDFYEQILGLERIEEPGRPIALRCGDQKISLHEIGQGFEPKAAQPTPGSADFCLITVFPIDEVQRQLKESGVNVERGPVPRTGAQGPMMSIYCRDPDGNLVEISRYLTPEEAKKRTVLNHF